MTARLTHLPSLPRASGLLTWRWIRPLVLMLPLTPLTGQGPAVVREANPTIAGDESDTRRWGA